MIKYFAWIPFAASRYVSSRRRDKSSPSSMFSVIGIAVGVMALIVVIAVMNGFQLGFIESILEISSFHLRLESSSVPMSSVPSTSSGPDQNLLSSLRAHKNIAAALPFLDAQTIARGTSRSQQACFVRGLPSDANKQDAGLAEKLKFEDGFFDLESANTILLGSELARNLGVRVGDAIDLLSISGIGFASLNGQDLRFTVTGIFQSGFYEYDLGWSFVNLDSARFLSGDTTPFAYGIKLKDKWKDEQEMAVLNKIAVESGMHITSWRVFNRAFFGALRTEKLLMFILVGLIFIVVGLNVFQSQRRAVLERQDEIGLLRAIGASELAVRLVFTVDGFIIGLSGAIAGLIPGLLIASNIGAFFTVLENLANSAISIANSVVYLVSGSSIQDSEKFSVFSPAIFYIKEIPSRVVPLEIALIFLFGLLSATIAAALASARAARLRPAEVLRYE